MDLARFPIRHGRAILFLTTALTVLGVWAYLRTPASIFPAMHFSRIDVVASVGDLPPEQVRVAVTAPLERALVGLPSVQRIVSTSAQGSSELMVEFDPKTSAQVDLQYVNAAIAQTRSQTSAADTVLATIVVPESEPVLSYALTSSQLSQTLIHEYASLRVLPQLYGVPGLARILVVGGPPREYHLALEPSALATAGLSASDVASAVASANTVQAVGIAEGFTQRRAVLVDARLRDATELTRVIVPTRDGNGIPVGSLGNVRLGVAPPSNQMAFKAEHAVALSFYALPGADNVAMARAIKARMARISDRLPGDARAHLYWDATDLILASQASLRDAILVGALLALGVIFFFLRNLRMTLVAAIVIPAAMAIAVLAISSFGETLNIMSVGGLAIAVGLIIDDAIVVIEGIARTLGDDPDLPVRDAVVATMRRLIGPMTASTLTTVVVFVPLALLGGVSGAFFQALAITLSCALFVSLGLSVFVTPILVRGLVGRSASHAQDAAQQRLFAVYEPILRWALSRRNIVYAGAGAILVLTVALVAFLPTDFLPHLDEGQFEIAYRMPVGTTLAASDAAALRIERVVLADPAVASEGRVTGIDTNGYSPTPVRTGIIRVRLRPLGQRPGFDAVADRLRDAIGNAVPAAQLNVHQILEDLINDISGVPTPIEVVLRGNDQATLVETATRLSKRLAQTPGITDVSSGVDRDDPTLAVEPNLSRLTRARTDTPALVSALAAQTQGSIATELTEPAMQVPVRIAVARDTSGAPASVSLPGGTLAVADLARTSIDRSSTDVSAIDGQRATIVTANTAGRSLSATIEGVRKAIAQSALPPGYTAEIGGAYRAQQDSFAQFVTVIVIALALVYFVMLWTFGSFRKPLIILAAVPLAPIGVAIALTLTRTAFNVSSFMGLLLLVGLVVKNGILLIDAADRFREGGFDPTEALVRGAAERLRPILMTVLAAIFGLLPLAFGIGAGAAMEQPLAIAVVGGLSTATLFTLVLIPVLYATFTAREPARA